MAVNDWRTFDWNALPTGERSWQEDEPTGEESSLGYSGRAGGRFGGTPEEHRRAIKSTIATTLGGPLGILADSYIKLFGTEDEEERGDI